MDPLNELEEGQVPDEIQMALKGKQSILNQGLVNLSISNKDDIVRIAVETPKGVERLPCDVVCVLDISGSMATEAHVKNSEGVKEMHGLSYLDLLKHATKTIISTMSEKDRFGLVSYSDDARVEFDIDQMNEKNKQLAIKAVENLQDEGCTNIWSGVNRGLEMLRKNNNLKNHQAVMLLTDGEPNIFPPSGLVNQFKKYRESHKHFDFTLNTYAFGKHIDTPLLDKYAIIGNGQYSFIPCPGFIGTVFVNGISNILSTMGSNCQIDITMQNGVKIRNVLGNLPVEKQGKKCSIKIGDLKYDQPREIAFQIDIPDQIKMQKNFEYMDVKLQYYDYAQKKNIVGLNNKQVYHDWDDPLVLESYYRCLFVDQAQQATKLMKEKKDKEAQDLISNLSKDVENALKYLEDQEYQLDEFKDGFKLLRITQASKFLSSLKQDIDGEVTLAIAKYFSFDHWGKHFLPSLCHAHMKQQCNNFCDPGIQKYGGNFFQIIKEQVEQTFLSLPAPKPSKKPNNYQQIITQQQQKQQKSKKKKNSNNSKINDNDDDENDDDDQNNNIVKPQQNIPEPQIDMNDYYNCGGGCFQGNGNVQLADGSLKKINQIQKGDQIKGQNGQIGKIKCVIQINIGQNNKYNYFPLVRLNESGLLITPKHPIYDSKTQQWVKPYKMPHTLVLHENQVFNFVLDQNFDNKNSIVVNGIICVTLGHEIKQQEAYHKYFGDQKVIRDLQQIGGYENGYIIISDDQFIRNRDNSVQMIQQIANN